jgi:hypothetical protein
MSPLSPLFTDDYFVIPRRANWRVRGRAKREPGIHNHDRE